LKPTDRAFDRFIWSQYVFGGKLEYKDTMMMKMYLATDICFLSFVRREFDGAFNKLYMFHFDSLTRHPISISGRTFFN